MQSQIEYNATLKHSSISLFLVAKLRVLWIRVTNKATQIQFCLLIFKFFQFSFIWNRELCSIKSVNRSYLTSHWLCCISISKIFSSINIAVTNSKYETFFWGSSHDKDIVQKTIRLLLSLFLQFLFSEIIFICMLIVF